jgi:hypothetical protein
MNNDYLVVDAKDDTSEPYLELRLLPQGFVLGNNDVLCGRGKKCFKHIGNLTFRKLIQERLQKYDAAATKTEKTFIIREVVNIVRDTSPNGGFVKRDTLTGRYYEVGDTMAVSVLHSKIFISFLISTNFLQQHEKTSQAFRDMLYELYKSICASELRKRFKEKSFNNMIEANLRTKNSNHLLNKIPPTLLKGATEKWVQRLETTNSCRKKEMMSTSQLSASEKDNGLFQQYMKNIISNGNNRKMSIDHNLVQQSFNSLHTCSNEHSNHLHLDCSQVLYHHLSDVRHSSKFAQGRQWTGCWKACDTRSSHRKEDYFCRPHTTFNDNDPKQQARSCHNITDQRTTCDGVEWENLFLFIENDWSEADDPFEPVPL